MEGINITLFDLALAFIRVHDGPPSLDQHTHFLINPGFLRMVQCKDDAVRQQQLLTAYFILLSSHINSKEYFDNITYAFGHDAVENELAQSFIKFPSVDLVGRTIDHSQQLKYLQKVPNIATSLLINHKQLVIKFIQGCEERYLTTGLSTIYAMALDDPTKQQANQNLVFQMFEKVEVKWKKNQFNYNDDKDFISLLPLLRLVEPSDRLLGLLSRLPPHITCQAITHLGPSFQNLQFYKDHLESIVLKEVKTPNTLCYLGGVAKLFGSLGESLPLDCLAWSRAWVEDYQMNSVTTTSIWQYML
ncbi:hypothetical protein SAMD00019534_082740 [Acytostelium subglobosum LB1]|uniref:hypothetical protein n=1 Tax=Acytostelium subglobosum LB1 TaxID=1410327 RepID=UPI000644F362|nr:hypothetical protein SAMD00019534_082740 [Acytostelium subglobosum LB1]GAM25099.1 hypothetical protein SAMD00019534_082740 [Acytostelium subglobosum LB1]|eukprot:XP_012752188.1 hypothetical protein SAMD00019534_082740 [Acytostelium subglobosum LB1]